MSFSSYSKLIFLLLPALVFSCAQSKISPDAFRAPAQAAVITDEMENDFQQIWASEIPSAEMVRRVNRLVSLYLRTQKILMDFDEEQKGDLQPLTSSDNYGKLQVLRVMQEEQVDHIAFLYGRMIDMEQSKDPAQSKRGEKILSAFSRFCLLNRNKFHRLAMQNLSREIRAVREAKQIKVAELSGFEFQSPEEIVSFLDKKEDGLDRREALAEAAKKEAAARDAEFDEAYSEYRRVMTNTQRAPQSGVSFFPSTGRQGNIFGYELPMGTFALTFDDGPSSNWTPKILTSLREKKMRASFFWLAKNLANHSMDEIVYNAKKAGHTLGNHSYSHADLNKAGVDLDREINQSTAVQKEIYGTKPSYFRCPYGSCIFRENPRVRKMIADLRMLHVTWTIDSLDWQDKDPNSVFQRVVKAVEKNGRGIILFHDIHPQSYSASTMLIRYFANRRDELKLRTISEIVRELNELPQYEPPPTLLRWLPLPWGNSR